MASRSFLVTYAYVPQMEERRGPHRPDHLAYAKKAHAEGALILAAAMTDPVDGAILVFTAESEAAIHAWVASDPYAKEGLIRGVTIRELAIAVGGR